MKSAADRNQISGDAGEIRFEVEGTGVWDDVPFIIVKGFCDYSDCRKHKGSGGTLLQRQRLRRYPGKVECS